MSINPNILNQCGCCTGLELLTPMKISNSAGLNELFFRIGTHGTFKESMLRKLSESVVLSGLTTREDDDATIALMDAWALVLDILTFYNERIVNEGYIRTSNDRLSLFELSKHISYQPKPGVAAGAWFSFLLDVSPGAPAEAMASSGTKVQSIPEQNEKSQIFETIEKIQVKARWNEIHPKLSQEQTIEKGCTRLFLQGTDTLLQPGDTILIVGEKRLNYPGSERWDIRTVQSITIDNEAGHTLITWREGLGHEYPSTDPAVNPKVYVFRQRAALFGHNAPDFRNMSLEVKQTFYSDYDSVQDTDWREFEIQEHHKSIIYLDAVYPKILADSWLALIKPGCTELYKALRVKAASQTNFSLSSKTNKILLDTNEHLYWFPLRETVVLAQSEELQLAKAPILIPVFGKSIQLDREYPELMKEQKLIISGEPLTHLQVTERKIIIKRGNEEELIEIELFFVSDGSSIKLKSGELLEVTNVPQRISDTEVKWFVKHSDLKGYVKAKEGDLIPYEAKSEVKISKLPTSLNQPEIVSELIKVKELSPLEHPDKITFHSTLQNVYLRHTVKINANVAQATHGETKTEILGSGDGARIFQKFQLKQKPLTYISSSSASGSESTLEITVNDIKWKEVRTFYGRTSEERIFISRIEEDGSVYIQFGDGITGARLPSGVENVRATYRVGIGFEGLLKVGQLSFLMTPQLGIKSVTNLLPTTGADESELRESIRQNAPLTVLTLDRIVSIMDYENFTNAFAGIGKASADLLWKGEDRIVHLTVASANKEAIEKSLQENLVDAINDARHDNFTVVVNSFDKKLFKVNALIKIADDYNDDKVIARTKDVLKESFSFESRNFGQGVTPGEVIAVIQSVEGVTGVDLDKLDNRDPFSEEHFRLKSNIARWEGSTLKAAELLLIDPDNIDISLME